MKTAFVFPGQGAQSVGMMAPYDTLAVVRTTFDEASSVLNQDLWALAAEGPAEALNQTINTQPLMLTASVAIYRAWLAAGGRVPDVVAGHSLGEYAALVAANVLTFADALKAIQYRASVMQNAMPEGGGMAAVLGLDADKLTDVCREAAGSELVLELANYNAPGQIVIAGHQAAVEKAAVIGKQAGAKRVAVLAVSGPFHSSLMAGAAEKMAAYLADVPMQSPTIPVYHNVDASLHTDPAEIRAILAQQIRSSVQWIQTVERFAQDGVQCIIETGPGKVLTGLNKRIAPSMTHITLSDASVLTQTAAKGDDDES